MLAGIKLIPREVLLEHEEDNLNTEKQRRKTGKKENHHHNSSDEVGSGRDKRRAGKSKRKMRSGSEDWRCSDSDSDSFQRVTSSYFDKVDKSSKSRNRTSRHERDGRKKRDRVGRRNENQSGTVDEKKDSDGDIGSMVDRNNGILRKEMGLEWMLQAGNTLHGNSVPSKREQEGHQVEEGKKMNPKELNPYLQDNGSGYSNDALNSAAGSSQLLSSSLVGDGGASWRLKALKRAKEQAAREGLTLQEVVGIRWGSLQELATSVAVHRSAPAHAHLHAIKERKKGQTNIDETQYKLINSNDYKQDLFSEHLDMKKPKQDNLQWRTKQSRTILEDSSLVSEALSCINKFSNDGSFLNSMINQQNKDSNVQDHSFLEIKEAKNINEKDLASESRDFGEVLSTKIQAVSSNQLAAKMLQLKMKGKHEEADNLSKHMNLLVENSNARPKAKQQEAGGCTSRFTEKQLSSERKKHEDDGDKHLAQKIMQNKRYSMSGNADDEYDFYEGAPSRKHYKKKAVTHEDKINLPKRILTQKERCQFCFENPSRPKHLVISIGNVTYMMLPPWEPFVQGHCCIMPLQHESATRTIDKNVWEEIRNFKKCLLKMFLRQDKDAIFLETVIGLSRQRRHCLIECIPIPSHIAKQAPLYFKKAIDEAEDEWGQHDMKKVIPTSGNLRNVIPENFSYFHVEFGLDRGFVHVIDDDSNFPSSFGLNVVRGMLHLPVETMHHHQRREPAEKQKEAIATFVQEWEPFDWTRELD